MIFCSSSAKVKRLSSFATKPDSLIQDPLIRILLVPVSLLFGVGIALRDFFYRKGMLKSFQFDVPVISVGNLSVGGAGKTPHIEYLIRILQPYLEVATLSRGYRRKSVGYRIVQPDSTVEETGDEPLMFKRKFPGVFVTVNEQRAMGISRIMSDYPATQVVLLDDAFQHRAVQPGLNILLTEYNHPFTRDFLLPSGRLREWRSAYFRADLIILTKCPESMTEEDKQEWLREINPYSHQQVFFTNYRYLRPYYILNPRYRLELQDDISVLMVCAIANKEYMQGYLESKVQSVRTRAYPDHHYFTESDLDDIIKMFEAMPGGKKLIVTTEKDAVRLIAHRQRLTDHQLPVVVLPVEVNFLFGEKEKFDSEVKRFLLEFKV